MSDNLWCPIEFFGKPIHEPPIQLTDEPYTPSFCDPSIPELPPAPISHSGSFYEREQVGIHFFPQMVPPTTTPSNSASRPKEETPKRKRQPKAYDIAVELMASVPLRMVNDALFAFDGRVYRFVSTSVMNRLIMQCCRQYVQYVGDASIIERIYKVIQSEPNIVFRPTSEDCPFVSLEDGLLDLRSMTLGQWNPAPFVTVHLNGNYTRGQQTTCPVFDDFLCQITGGDSVLIERIWECIGYALVPDTKGKAFILLQGVSDSGKSLLGSIIAALIDEDLVTSLDISAMGDRFAAAELVGKQLCLSLDMPSGALDPKAVSNFKNFTGGDIVTADVKYQPRIKFRCSCTFVVATNHALLTRDRDPALMRRAATVPFLYSIEKEAQDHGLKDRILCERDAIIYRALCAYQRLKQKHYRFSGDYEPNEVVFGHGQPQNNLADALWTFCHTCCVPAPDSFVSTASLYTEFLRVTNVPWSGGLNQFSSEVANVLYSLFPDTVRKDRRRPKGTSENAERGYAGIALRSWNEST